MAPGHAQLCRQCSKALVVVFIFFADFAQLILHALHDVCLGNCLHFKHQHLCWLKIWVGLLVNALAKDVGFVEATILEALLLDQVPFAGIPVFVGRKHCQCLQHSNAVLVFLLDNVNVFTHWTAAFQPS